MAVRLTTPVTIVTGFLGSGKSTLVNRILREPHGALIAVIENEYGEVGVDAEFLSMTGDETIVQLANGCVCCSVRGDLARALQGLVERARERNIAFDRVLIETTGLADPGPVIQTFLAETAIEAWFHLDGVVTIVDARNVQQHAERVEFGSQVGYADRIVISKIDLANGNDDETLMAQLAALNPRAPAVACDLHRISIEKLVEHVFDIRGFSNDYVPVDEVRRALQGAGLLARSGGRFRSVRSGRHTQDVTAAVFTAEVPLDLERLNATLDGLVARYGARLWRCKGIVNTRGQRCRLIVQGVQGLVQINGGTIWRPFEPRRTVLVFIGQRLNASEIDEALRTCVMEHDSSAA